GDGVRDAHGGFRCGCAGAHEHGGGRDRAPAALMCVCGRADRWPRPTHEGQAECEDGAEDRPHDECALEHARSPVSRKDLPAPPTGAGGALTPHGSVPWEEEYVRTLGTPHPSPGGNPWRTREIDETSIIWVQLKPQ